MSQKFDLVVTEPFADHAKGDRLQGTPSALARLADEYPNHVVRTAHVKPDEPEADDAADGAQA